MSLATREALIEPRNSIAGVEASEIAYSCDLKHNDTIVVVDGSHIEKLLYYASGAKRCFYYPEGHKRPAKIYGGA